MTVSLSTAAAIAACDAVVDLVDGGSGAGSCVIYSGTPPTDASTALAGNTVLADVTLDDPAFGAASDGAPGGEAAMAGLPLSDLSIDATGTASFFRLLDSDDSVVMQGTVGTSSTDMIVDSVSFASGATFTIVTFTYNSPET